MTSEGLGEMFEDESADTCGAEGRAEGLACADPGARTPISMSGNFTIVLTAKKLILPGIFNLELKINLHVCHTKRLIKFWKVTSNSL